MKQKKMPRNKFENYFEEKYRNSQDDKSDYVNEEVKAMEEQNEEDNQ